MGCSLYHGAWMGNGAAEGTGTFNRRKRSRQLPSDRPATAHATREPEPPLNTGDILILGSA